MKKQEIVKKKTIKMQDLDIENSFLDDKKRKSCRIQIFLQDFHGYLLECWCTKG